MIELMAAPQRDSRLAGEYTELDEQLESHQLRLRNQYYTVFQKKTPTHIIGCKLRSSCLILIIFDIKIPHII